MFSYNLNDIVDLFFFSLFLWLRKHYQIVRVTHQRDRRGLWLQRQSMAHAHEERCIFVVNFAMEVKNP